MADARLAAEEKRAEAEEHEPAGGAEADRGIAPIEATIGDDGHDPGRIVDVGRPGCVCAKCWSTDEQYWWHVPRVMCTVGCSLARDGVPGPQRPAVAAAGMMLASATTIARPLRMRFAWRCMRSPFGVVSALFALPWGRCSLPVAHGLREVDRRLRAAGGA